jgi:hypothetical protein
MKYIFLILTIISFASCNTQNDTLTPPDTTCYFKIILNDPLNTCNNNPNHLVSANWGYGFYQLTNNSQHTTNTFEFASGYSQGINLTNNNQCNTITVEFYADNVLVETQNTTLGVQSDCQTYCTDGISRTLTFTVP